MRGIRTIAFVLAISIFLGCCSTAFAENSTNNSEVKSNKYFTIRVKLTSLGSITSIELTTKGNYSISQNGYNASDTKIAIGVLGSDLQVMINGSIAYKGQQITLSRESVIANAGDVTIAQNSRKYLGDFNFYCESGSIVVVNHVPMAYYLYGVLAAEMNNSYPLEALKAQAVAAKCYAIMRMKPNSNYDIRDQSTDQAYKGYNATWTNIFDAVDSSIANIVTYNGDMITTYYSSTNGGETNYPTYQWTGAPSLNNGYAVAIDSYDFSNSNSRMETVTVDLGSQSMNNEIKLMLKDMTKTLTETEPADIIKIDDFYLHSPKHPNLTRNMTSVTVKYVAKMSADSEETQNLELIFPVSKLLSFGVFKDSSLAVYWGEKIGNKYNIYHVRWGHGVGLSQRGAQARALDGHKFIDILKFYFPTAEMSLMDIRVPTSGPNIEPPKPIPPVVEDSAKGVINFDGAMQAAKPQKNRRADISLPGDSSILKPRYDVIETGYITGSQVNMRSGPSTQFTIVAKLTLGTSLEILDMSNPSWYRVKVGDLFGYVSSQYIQLNNTTPTPEYDTYKEAKINTSGVNFRTKPNTTCVSLGKLDKNTQVYVWDTAGASNDWYFVQYGFVYGYVHSPYVDILTTCEYKPSSDPVLASGKTLFSVDFYSYPAINSTVIKTLQTDTQVEILALNNGWYYAMNGGIVGYVVESSVEMQSCEPLCPSTTVEFFPTALGTGRVNTTNVKFRSQPNTSSDILSVFPIDANITIYSILGDWYGIIYNDTYGYIFAQYVTTTVDEPQNLQGITLSTGKCTANTLNFRQLPNTDSAVLSQLAKNDTFMVIGAYNDWYFIMLNGITGYVLGDFVEITDSGDLSPLSVPADWQSINTKTQSAVNFRMGPSVAFSIICKLEANTQVHVLAYFSGDWCMVLYKGAIGFVSRQYLLL